MVMTMMMMDDDDADEMHKIWYLTDSLANLFMWKIARTKAMNYIFISYKCKFIKYKALTGGGNITRCDDVT